MKQIFILLIVVTVSSCATTVKSSLGPDNYDPFSDELLIKTGFSDKAQTFKFSFMKSKMSRSKYIKRMNKLNEEALGYFKSDKMKRDDYGGYAEVSKVLGQLLWYITALTDGSSSMQSAAKSALNNKSLNITDSKTSKLVGPVMQKLDVNNVKDGAFEQVAEQFIAILDELLKPFRAGGSI